MENLKEMLFQRFALSDEKFAGIAICFEERDAKRELERDEAGRFLSASFSSRDTAVSAALAAQERSVSEQNRSSAAAIAKSETATAKAIDQLQLLLQTNSGGLESKISDIKDRITVIEGKTVGAAAAHTESHGSQLQWVGILGLIFGTLIGTGGLLVSFMSSKQPQVIERTVIEQPLGSPLVPLPMR